MIQISEIDNLISIFKKHNCPLMLMHTVSTYPSKLEDLNLNCIQTLKNRYELPVGYSGHEVGLAISFGAAALGISSLERHITLDRAMYGSDQAASIEPAGLKQLVGGIRKIVNALGNGKKSIIDEEINIARKLRAHIK